MSERIVFFTCCLCHDIEALVFKRAVEVAKESHQCLAGIAQPPQGLAKVVDLLNPSLEILVLCCDGAVYVPYDVLSSDSIFYLPIHLYLSFPLAMFLCLFDFLFFSSFFIFKLTFYFSFSIFIF